MANSAEIGAQTEGNLTGNANANSARFFPRVEVVDILSDWANFTGWRARTSRTNRWGAFAECVVTPGYELHALTTLESRLSPRILCAGRKHTDFAALWKFLADHYQTNLVNQTGHSGCALTNTKAHPNCRQPD